MEKIDEISHPPVVGTRYLVPCSCGKLTLYGTGFHWYPVFLPSHEDGKYAGWWKNGKLEYTPTTADFHYHIDPRFVPMEWYDCLEARHSTMYENKNNGVKWMEMECLREMPTPITIYKVFGPLFIDDYKNSSIKCNRCPHKGVYLKSSKAIDNKITCPAHGLQFDATTLKCVTIE